MPSTRHKRDISSKNWSPEFTITYKPSDTFTVFAAFKQAYKSGSFDIVIPSPPPANKSFGDEKVQGGEVGIKSRWLDRSLSFDMAGYYYRYTGLQTGVNEPNQNGLPVLRTINAGKGEVYGIDMEMKYRPPTIDGLALNFALNYNRTKFLELDNVPCRGGQQEAQGCNRLLGPQCAAERGRQAQLPIGALPGAEPSRSRFRSRTALADQFRLRLRNALEQWICGWFSATTTSTLRAISASSARGRTSGSRVSSKAISV